MRAIVIESPRATSGKARGALVLRDVAWPEPGPGQVRVRVAATAVNRADLLQRTGAYPAPHDAPADIPGMEIAGTVDALGEGASQASGLLEGDRVFGIVGGGGYAEAVVVHARTLAKIPQGVDDVFAAAIPEAFITAYDAMITQAGLQAGETVLVSAVGSGVGTAAVQIARSVGARVIGTARSEDKLTKARELGMCLGIRPRTGEGNTPLFAEEVRAKTEGRGADMVLELVGGAYVPEALEALAERGRLMLVGLLAGARADVDLGLVLRRRLVVRGTVLRSRPLEEKILAGQLLARHIAPLVGDGVLRPIVDRVMPLEDAEAAHRYVADNTGFGKVVLRVSPTPA